MRLQLIVATLLMLPHQSWAGFDPAFTNGWTTAISAEDAWSNVFWAVHERCEATYRYSYPSIVTNESGGITTETVRVYGVTPPTIVGTNLWQDSSTMVICGIVTQGEYRITNLCPAVVTNVSTNATSEIMTYEVAASTLATLKMLPAYYVPATCDLPNAFSGPLGTNYASGVPTWTAPALWEYLGIGSIQTGEMGELTVHFTAQDASATQTVTLAEFVRIPSQVTFTSNVAQEWSGDYSWDGFSAYRRGDRLMWVDWFGLWAVGSETDGTVASSWWAASVALTPDLAGRFELLYPPPHATGTVVIASNSQPTAMTIVRGSMSEAVPTRSALQCGIYVETTQAVASLPDITIYGMSLTWTNGAWEPGSNIAETVTLATNEPAALSNVFGTVTGAVLSAPWPDGISAMWVGYRSPMQYDDLSWWREPVTMIEAHSVLTNLLVTAPQPYIFNRESVLEDGGLRSDGCSTDFSDIPPSELSRHLGGAIAAGDRTGWSDRWFTPAARGGEYLSTLYGYSGDDMDPIAQDRGVYAEVSRDAWVEPFVLAGDSLDADEVSFWAADSAHVLSGLAANGVDPLSATTTVASSAPVLLEYGHRAIETATNGNVSVGAFCVVVGTESLCGFQTQAVFLADAAVSLDADLVEQLATSALRQQVAVSFDSTRSECLPDYAPPDKPVIYVSYDGFVEAEPVNISRTIIALVRWAFRFR